MNKVLIEIGVEEIPADYLKPASLQLKQDFEKFLKEKRIEYKNVKSFYTVRRFVLLIEGIAEKQKDIVFEKKGPKYELFYDSNNNLTDTGKIFLKKNNINENDIKVKEIKNTKYIFATIEEKGKSSYEILSKNIPLLIQNIKFPKSMRWDDSGVSFARPIRWILAMFNVKVINFKVGNVQSGNTTKLHKYVHENKNVPIKSIDEYFSILNKYGIILSQEERKKIILEKISEKLTTKKLKILDDDDLLEKIASSVEKISVMVGTFDEKYLFLPKEVIITAMREHQRYFSVLKENGTFTNYFVNIRDGDDLNNDNIVEEHAKVLYARLNDAEFFYNEDLKNPLENNLPKLKEIIFISNLGSVYEKIQRLKNIIFDVKDYFGYKDAKILEEIINLSKCDLVTNMIEEKEFVSLRGFMGSYYLQKQGKDKKICMPIRDQYLPEFVGGKLPETEEGVILSVLDKIDNIIGFFIGEFKPTGSKDPYAVRKQALNIIYMIIEKKLSIPLHKIIEKLLIEYEKQFSKNINIFEIIDFFKQREKNYFKEKNIDYDIINASIDNKELDIYADFKKASCLMEKRKKTNFNEIVFAVSRVINIVPLNFKAKKVEETLFEKEEKNLYEKYKQKIHEFENALLKKDYDKVFDIISDFKVEIDEYFDKILVMTEDKKLQENRLSMLYEIKNMFLKFINFEKIVIDREKS